MNKWLLAYTAIAISNHLVQKEKAKELTKT